MIVAPKKGIRIIETSNVKTKVLSSMRFLVDKSYIPILENTHMHTHTHAQNLGLVR